jgi:putative transposase
MDIITDSLVTGRRSRTLNVVDDYTWQCMRIEVDTLLSDVHVARVLVALHEQRSGAEVIVVDSSPEFSG